MLCRRSRRIPRYDEPKVALLSAKLRALWRDAASLRVRVAARVARVDGVRWRAATAGWHASERFVRLSIEVRSRSSAVGL